MESLYKNIYRNKHSFFKAIAAKLVTREKLSSEQLEFILAYAPDIAGKAAPYLYKEAKRIDADHIIDSLRLLWTRYGSPTPIECPRCGFRALTPELTCIVCGAQIDEKELKEYIGFEALLEDFARKAPLTVIQEVISSGLVLYDGERIMPLSQRSRGYFVELYLTQREKEILERIMKERQALGDYF